MGGGMKEENNGEVNAIYLFISIIKSVKKRSA